MEQVTLYMKRKFWNKQVSIIDYFMIQSGFNAGINITFYVCIIIFVRLSVKYNIFSCSLVSDIFNVFPKTVIFLYLLFAIYSLFRHDGLRLHCI